MATKLARTSVRVRVADPFGWFALLSEFGQWLASHVVQNVPEDMSYCEYECHDVRCNMAKQAVCVKYSSHRDSRYLRIE